MRSPRSWLPMLVSCGWLCAQIPSTEGGLGSVKVRVVDPHGGPVSCFALSILRDLPDPWTYGVVPGVSNRQVQPRDLQVDAFLLDDVPAGQFVVSIDTLGFARTISPAFRIEAGASTEVVVSLRIHHDAFCDHVVRDIQVAAGSPVQLDPVKLRRGAVIEGAARNSERLWVCVFARGLEGQRLAFRCEAESDAHGRFRLPQRVPPGDYTIAFMRISERGDGQALFTFHSPRQHEQPLHVAAGQEQVTVDVIVR